MHKSLLIFLFLSAFSLNLAAGTFIESIKLDHVSFDYHTLLKKVSRHRWYPGQYLSLGESHLHPSTSRPVLLQLAKTFLEDTPLSSRFCSKNIQDFLNSFSGREIQRLADNISIFYTNSPSQTDFWGCAREEFDLTLTYSGFFHQHPFARPFPDDFQPTPVITDPKNSILAQMPAGKGLFVSLMEMDFLEMTTSRAILKMKIRDVDTFRTKVTQLGEKIESLHSKMETLLNGSTEWRTKMGMILEQDHFENRSVLPKNTFILLTDLKARFKRKPLKLLHDLSNLSDSALEKYLDFMASERAFFTTSLQEPAEDGTMYPTGYGTYPLQFPGGSEFLDLVHANKKSILLVSSPDSKELRCLTKYGDQTVELDCEDIFKN